jgi:hypothetical protein
MKGLRYALVLGLTLVALGVAAAFVILKLRAGLTGASNREGQWNPLRSASPPCCRSSF